MKTDKSLYELKKIAIEPYANGYLLADYSGNRGEASYCGVSMDWRRQSIVHDPFPTKEEAFAAGILA